ncbi:MAG: zinc-binding dehydrogenase [Anaerolineales bacterium]|nr:zinc-binding dehydrogenase [Anaerolineales bacterium]
MKSVYIYYPEPNEIAIGEEEVSAPGPGEVLCRAEKSLISTGTETFCLRGESDPGTNWAAWVKFPFRPGYSMVGRVVEVGEGVAEFKVGDRVFAWQTHQQCYKLKPEQAQVIPEDITAEEAAWLAIALITQVGVRRAQLEMGETVGVVGLGILGQLVVQYLHLIGARRIMAIDPYQTSVDAAKTHGATHALNLAVDEALPAIREITDGKMLDVVFDVTGHAEVFADCMPLLRSQGRLLLLGDSPMPSRQRLGPGVVSEALTIIGSHASTIPDHPSAFAPWGRNEIGELFLDYLRQKRMNVVDLITHRYNPLEAPKVYADLERDRSQTLGVIFDWELL